jgi:hypothetical protein
MAREEAPAAQMERVGGGAQRKGHATGSSNATGAMVASGSLFFVRRKNTRKFNNAKKTTSFS